MPFEIIQGDITRIQADAIVNAANPQLQMGGGVCGAIFMAAGPRKLQTACDRLAPIHTGEAVITPGFALPARFVIHTAGPVYSRQCFRICWELCLRMKANGCSHRPTGPPSSWLLNMGAIPLPFP